MSDRAHKLRRKRRQLQALADDPAASPEEADNARRAAEGIAAELRALGVDVHQVEPEPLDGLDPIDYATRAPRVDPASGPTISVHINIPGHQVRSHHVAARWWCPPCGMGRNHNGRCPVCDGPTEVVPKHMRRVR